MMDWRQYAACRDEDPEVFFPAATFGSPPYAGQLRRAQRVCDRCPVIYECREWALIVGERAGVWGGVDMDVRSRARP